MRRDHRPYGLKRLHLAVERAWLEHFLRPQFDALGPGGRVMRPWRVDVRGRNIRIGRAAHLVAAPDRRIAFTTWDHGDHSGRIDIGDYVLICPGVRLDSASHISIGSNSMIAAGAYLTDSDWHDLYDRTRIIGTSAPISVEDNVWIGDGVIVCKGVTVGANSVIGAGSVVTRDIPANVVAGGNPAAVIRPLDPEQALVTRESLLADARSLESRMDGLDRYLLRDNTWWRWLRTVLRPGPDD